MSSKQGKGNDMSQKMNCLEYQKSILELYKVHVEMANNISIRRQSTNSFFLSINTGTIALIGYILSNRNIDTKLFFCSAASIAGILLCYFWYRQICSYKVINSAKFKIIQEMETKLEFQPYTDEWKILGQSINKEKYLPMTTIEKQVTYIFASLYVIIILWAILWPVLSK